MNSEHFYYRDKVEKIFHSFPQRVGDLEKSAFHKYLYLLEEGDVPSENLVKFVKDSVVRILNLRKKTEKDVRFLQRCREKYEWFDDDFGETLYTRIKENSSGVFEATFYVRDLTTYSLEACSIDETKLGENFKRYSFRQKLSSIVKNIDEVVLDYESYGNKVCFVNVMNK